IIQAEAWRGFLALGFALFIARAGCAGAPGRAECDYGAKLALEGNLAAAESVFTSLLSLSPGDPRALANLGNLHLLRGDRDSALALYRLAAAADGADAGLHLDRAIALFLMSQDDLAREAAAEAVARAGGSRRAVSLLRLRNGAA